MKQRVASNKPRVQAVVPNKTKEEIALYIAIHDSAGLGKITESKAVGDAVTAYFGIGTSRIEKLIRLAAADQRTPGAYLQRQLAKLIDDAHEEA